MLVVVVVVVVVVQLMMMAMMRSCTAPTFPRADGSRRVMHRQCTSALRWAFLRERRCGRLRCSLNVFASSTERMSAQTTKVPVLSRGDADDEVLRLRYAPPRLPRISAHERAFG